MIGGRRIPPSTRRGRLVMRGLSPTPGLPKEQFLIAEKPEFFIPKIFTQGLTFLQLALNAQWAESEKRLQMIDADGWADDIDGMAGPEFLKEVREKHEGSGRG